MSDLPNDNSRSSSQRVLVLFAHPALEKSRVNRLMIEGVDTIEGVTFHDLYEAYPDFDIDVGREQTLLSEHDIVVLHHPFYWYSTPALVKQWEDLVLEHGWAYGHEGNALRDKALMSVITTGGRESAYQPGGYNRYSIHDLLRPIEQTARLCGMRYLDPFIVYGTLAMPHDEVLEHASRYRALLRRLTRGEARTVEEG
jgi:glutathione-regulated potassium-efflux system ancillary protein KefG